MILSQIFNTEENRQKNALLPINTLEKEVKDSDPTIRIMGLKLLGDMSSCLADIFPFLYDLFKASCFDNNMFVRITAYRVLGKLLEANKGEYVLTDYKE